MVPIMPLAFIPRRPLGVLALALVALAAALPGQAAVVGGIHWQAHGDPSRPSLVFIHGGPGWNSRQLEMALAKDLSRDHHVVFYDQAGCGQSEAPKGGAYRFAAHVADLKAVLAASGAKQPLLVGHAFGGTLALQALEDPTLGLRGAVLVGTPIDQPAALRALLRRCRAHFAARGNQEGLDAMAQAEAAGPASVRYATDLITAARFLGFNSAANPTPEAKALAAAMREGIPSFWDRRTAPFEAFVRDEGLFMRQDQAVVQRHASRLGAIYGAEDWALAPGVEVMLRGALGPKRFRVVAGASQEVFLDQPSAFLAALRAVDQALTKPSAEGAATGPADGVGSPKR